MTDYFAFLGFPRTLALDDRELQQRYFARSREYHPDLHAQKPEAEQQEMLVNSSILNQAYRTLKDPFDRARYLLSLEGSESAEEKKKIPPELLMEVMEMQEKAAESKFEADPAKREMLHAELAQIEQRLQKRMHAMSEELAAISRDWDSAPEGSDSAKEAVLKRLSLLLNTRSYVRTLLATLAAELHGGEAVRH